MEYGMFNYVRAAFRRLTRAVFPVAEAKERVETSRLDAYLNWACRIVFWEDPLASWTTLTLVHVVFWYAGDYRPDLFIYNAVCAFFRRFVVYFQIRVIGLIFLCLLSGFLLDSYFEVKGLKEARTASYEAVRQVANVFNGSYCYLVQLRKDSPSTVSFHLAVCFV